MPFGFLVQSYWPPARPDRLVSNIPVIRASFSATKISAGNRTNRMSVSMKCNLGLALITLWFAIALNSATYFEGLDDAVLHKITWAGPLLESDLEDDAVSRRPKWSSWRSYTVRPVGPVFLIQWFRRQRTCKRWQWQLPERRNITASCQSYKKTWP